MPQAGSDARAKAPGGAGVLLANVLLGGLGLALLAQAWRMDASWGAEHFLPVWTWPWAVQLRILLALRLALVAVALAVLVLLRPWWVRACRAGKARGAFIACASALLAVVAALAMTELVLRSQTWHATQEQRHLVDPLRIRDRELGWTFAASRAASVKLDRRRVRYATGRFGYRVRAAGAAPDFTRPTVVFAGESIVFGYGLDWPQTIAARVEAMTGIQTANIAVNAHATDQIYLRLARELPRFAHPVAVVIPFMPRLLDRNLDTDRPHLDARLRWQPAGPPPIRLAELARRVVRFRQPGDIAHAEAATATVLKAAIATSQARGAKAIVLVPQYLPETEVERAIRREVLDRAGIAYLLVPIPPAWRSPAHGHPTAEGAAALAAAVAGKIAAMPTGNRAGIAPR